MNCLSSKAGFCMNAAVSQSGNVVGAVTQDRDTCTTAVFPELSPDSFLEELADMNLSNISTGDLPSETQNFLDAVDELPTSWMP